MTSPLAGLFSFVRCDARFALRSFLLGLPLLLLILLGLTGSFDTMATMLLLSLICTLGIAGFFWFGAALLLGGLIQLLLPFLRGQPPVRHGGDPRSISDLLRPQGAADSLVRYIQRREAEGVGEATVRTDLRRAGWNADQVAAALERARGSVPSIRPSAGG